MLEANWFKAWKGEKKFLPISQREGIQQVQQTLAPIQALIAVASGQWSGDMKALFALLNGQRLHCDGCSQPMTGKGNDHQLGCKLFAQAQEILTSDADYELQRLEQEQAQFLEKAAKKQAELELLRIEKNKCE